MAPTGVSLAPAIDATTAYLSFANLGNSTTSAPKAQDYCKIENYHSFAIGNAESHQPIRRLIASGAGRKRGIQFSSLSSSSRASPSSSSVECFLRLLASARGVTYSPRACSSREAQTGILQSGLKGGERNITTCKPWGALPSRRAHFPAASRV